MSIIFIRTLIVITSVILSLRLMGKRQLGELELSELVVAVMISDLAANPLQDIGMPLLNGLIPVVILLCFELIVSGVIMRSVKMRALLCGKPCMLVVNGVIDQQQMRSNRFTLDELTEELRCQSITDISTVQYAILETNGRLNTILFPSERPVTAGQLELNAGNTGYPTILINDGRLLKHNLSRMGKDDLWLEKELRKRSVKAPSDVYLMTLDEGGRIYFTPQEKKKS